MNIHPTKTKLTAVNESEELKDKIRRRAYQHYEERLWKNGHELEDWLRAAENGRIRILRLQRGET